MLFFFKHPAGTPVPLGAVAVPVPVEFPPAVGTLEPVPVGVKVGDGKYGILDPPEPVLVGLHVVPLPEGVGVVEGDCQEPPAYEGCE